MVAINRNILTLFVALVASTSVSAQQVKPRIAGLETNERYMYLLHEDMHLTQREDSVALVVESLRESFRSADVNSPSSRSSIISLENELFELRARKGQIVDSLSIIEQNWVINNMDTSSSGGDESPAQLVVSAGNSEANFIYESPNVESNLSQIDFNHLVKAEKMEAVAQQLASDFVINYDNLLSLSRSYQKVTNQKEAEQIFSKFDSLSRANVELLEQLDDSWAYIYDNKSFAYSLLMELLGFTDIFPQEAELMRRAQAEISAVVGRGDAAGELLRYYIQKRSMVEFEILVAEKLELELVATKFREQLKGLSSIGMSERKVLSLVERNFINYEPIEYGTKSFYSKANPIPERVNYERGVIFRIFVGSFQNKAEPNVFRNTKPVSHTMGEDKRHNYYIGGFESFEEAEQARAALKKHGFRAPHVVVWSDGKERTLTRDPLPISTVYRLEILDAPILPQGAAEMVANIAPDSPISKVGNDRYVVTSLSRKRQVDSLVNGLKALDPSLNISVERNEVEIEF